MKKILLVFCLLFTLQAISFAQFKNDNGFKPSVKDGIINDSPNFVLGFFDPSKFSMSHSYTMSYTSFAGNGLALGVYTNSMMYRFTDRFNVQVDASISHSPYNTFGKDQQNNLNGIRLSRAEVNYMPWDNFKVSLQYRNDPSMYYYGSPYQYNPFSFFNGR